MELLFNNNNSLQLKSLNRIFEILIYPHSAQKLPYLTTWVVIICHYFTELFMWSLWWSSTDIAYRIVADHARMMCVSIADGIRPSNIGLDGLKCVINRCLIHFLSVYICVCYYFISYGMQNSSVKEFNLLLGLVNYSVEVIN